MYTAHTHTDTHTHTCTHTHTDTHTHTHTHTDTHTHTGRHTHTHTEYTYSLIRSHPVKQPPSSGPKLTIAAM